MRHSTLLSAFLLTIFTALSGTAVAQGLQSPAQFLGYELGQRFTSHYQVVDYYQHVAENSDMVKLEQYGETYEYRPLLLVYISTPENLARLEEIRTDNLKRAGILPGQPSGNPVAIVWLSYNVHGNESVSTEASMMTTHYLISDEVAESKEWLENTVVVIDPCLNPDGRERYVNFYKQHAASSPNASPIAWEHVEPWPNGRANHYLFDLNRDWAWQSQKESIARIEEYNKWMPHIHADFHEQGVNEPYYFAPAAEPFHEVITPFQRDFQTRIGMNHARYFDQNNWLYFTRERFDLFYPSYGDTYPTYNGAIGMTYEQGGSGRGGLAVVTEEGDTLTLRDRIDHHHTAGISTVEVTSKNAEEVLNEFSSFFSKASSNPAGKYKAYVVRAEGAEDKVDMLGKWLDRQGIRYGYANSGTRINGFSYRSGREGNTFNTTDKDLVISAYQPKSTLLQVLFEPQSKLSDSVTYDITAWAVPYAYDMDVYGVTSRINPREIEEITDTEPVSLAADAYAYLIPWKSQKDLKTLAFLLNEGINVRYSEVPFTIDGKDFGRGTLIVTATGNEQMSDQLSSILEKHANEEDQEIIAVTTGFVTSGSDFGSDRVHFIKKPRVAVVGGDYVSSLAYGEVWHFFEQQIGYPVTTLNTSYLGEVDLNEFDVLILPNGYYNSVADESMMNKLSGWVRGGGKVIAMQGALGMFGGKEGFSLKEFATDEAKEQAQQKATQRARDERLDKYENRERAFIRNYIPGSIYKTRVDNTHPLAFGYPEHYFTLKLSDDIYSYLDNGWNVVALESASDKVSGFTGSLAEERLDQSLVFGVQEMGRGQIVYMADNPLFRAFWENGKLFFGNAVFFVGQ